MFCTSYLHACDSGVRLMPSEMEYDIFARTDTECTSLGTSCKEKEGEKERESVGYFSRLVYLLHSFIFCVCLSDSLWQMPRSQAKGCLSSSLRKSHCFQGSQHSGISHHNQAFCQMWSLFLSSSLCTHVPSSLPSFSPFYFTLPSPVLPFFLHS